MPSTLATSRALFAAIAVGAIALAARRRQSTSGRELIDWTRARAIAGLLAGSDGSGTASRDQQMAFERRVEKSWSAIADYLALPGGTRSIPVLAVTRAEWLDANVVSFRAMTAPLESLAGRASGQFGTGFFADANETLLTAQSGLLLGYLSRRVLGQFDIAIFGREPVETGKLYFVTRNIEETERRLGLTPEDFRLWIALHEVTHAVEFERAPWLREHMNTLLREYFATLAVHLGGAGTSLRDTISFARRVRPRRGGSLGLVDWVMSDDLRAILERMQALMCLLEGYSNHVMDAIGQSVLATYPMMKERFSARARKRSTGERLFIRLTGLEMKFEQYARGEAFVNQVAQLAGVATLDRAWRDASLLPTLAEIDAPRTWLARVA